MYMINKNLFQIDNNYDQDIESFAYLDGGSLEDRKLLKQTQVLSNCTTYGDKKKISIKTKLKIFVILCWYEIGQVTKEVDKKLHYYLSICIAHSVSTGLMLKYCSVGVEFDK